MGTFRIEVEGIGGHGVDREKKDGEKVDFQECGPYTPDAIGKSLVKALQQHGCSVNSAKIIHWPGEKTEVQDCLITDTRKGNF